MPPCSVGHRFSLVARLGYLPTGDLGDYVINDEKFHRSVIKIGELVAYLFHQLRVYVSCRKLEVLHGDKYFEQVIFV